MLAVGQPFGFAGCAIGIAAARQVHGFAPPPNVAGAGPLSTDDFSLPFTVGIRGIFCKIQLHLELSDLALKRSNASFVFGDDAGLGLFIRQLAPVGLRQPKLDAVDRDVMAALRIATPDDTGPDILAELQFERRRMSPVRTSGRHGALSTQGPSSVSDLQSTVVKPMGLARYPTQFWVQLNKSIRLDG